LHFDVVVIGAGATGLMCAYAAGRRRRRVLVLDHNAEPGAKILISGGGRCNFTNLNVTPAQFISNNPHFCKSALAGFSPQDFINMVAAQGIAFHEKTIGQLFCDGSARQILNMLVQNCTAAGVDLRLGHRVSSISKADGFRIETDHGVFTAASLVLATGGLSIPKLGATGFAYDIAKQFGLALTEIRPGLVPLIFHGEDWMQALSGVSLDAVASCGKTSFRERALFTHRGLSGPAILQISSYWKGSAVTLDMLPGADAYAFLLERKASRPKAALKTILSEALPARLAHHLAPGNHAIGDMPNQALQNTADKIKHFSLKPDGTEGYAKAEVTIEHRKRRKAPQVASLVDF
jgi:predicted Rossmann fold flavoprotein